MDADAQLLEQQLESLLDAVCAQQQTLRTTLLSLVRALEPEPHD